ncbi:hypothetical protein [Dickeya dianthicola]|uniref:hypothetical protein n=1 Tax=Dickeya dianthicola TaxID=204039 RepID=UPI000A60E9AB|nr:hypothetical protein [Dickeya dianthicola]ATO32834.1 hypothetical protein DDI_1666 [Dickeya dianthicola RNS04.9]MBT1427859.1 hypothetical protein [Dickeya dianthicola]MBT1431926.1 hypothetical protein [Dickeya dianthicola]MBT1459373.1 hypothetical protein [Dickeya dianthicola]MBT1488571.1 hypothetical protein [Dickeya dianthicola]
MSDDNMMIRKDRPRYSLSGNAPKERRHRLVWQRHFSDFSSGQPADDADKSSHRWLFVPSGIPAAL